jgi:hypothetical protein
LGDFIETKAKKLPTSPGLVSPAPTIFKLEGEVTSLSEGSQGEVGDNREKWRDFWEKLIVINQNTVSRPL